MKKMILDLDTGVDDALAISYALGSPEIELIGITGTYGNVLVEQGVRNALAVTDLLGHPEVKVYQGLPHSSTTDHFEVLPISAFIHGDNGIGDVEIPDSNRSVETESAVDFIIDAVKTYGKDLVYVPTGPMTNIEAALKKAPEIKDEIGQIVLMGGALTVPGNCNACMEANISQDPEAADYLFRSGAPTTMIGLDVTLQTLLTYKETQQWRDLGTKAGKFLADMTDFYIKAYETTSPHLGGCGLHDPLAVGVAVDPTLVTTLDINMKVDVDGPTRGRTIGDETRLNDPVKTMKVAVGVDVPRFLNEFMTRISASPQSAVNDGSRGKRSRAFPAQPSRNHHRNNRKHNITKTKRRSERRTDMSTSNAAATAEHRTIASPRRPVRRSGDQQQDGRPRPYSAADHLRARHPVPAGIQPRVPAGRRRRRRAGAGVPHHRVPQHRARHRVLHLWIPR